MKNYLITICFLFSCSLSWAQQRVVTGTVKDDVESLIGVAVFEKDVPDNGAQTNVDGKYTLTLKGKSGVLVFRYLGYLTKEVNVAGRSIVDVTLAIDAKGLEEVVVVGYGTQKKITNTGALSAISGDDIRQTPSASLQNTLIGRVPGVVTQQRSGQPGGDGARILIRGLSTTNGNGSPLIIVDDLEYAGSISDIDPDHIESFTVLKDAATTAVYGIKGANGVIVITTRRGKIGKPQITLRSENSLLTPNYMPDYLDAYESALLINRAVDMDLANNINPTDISWSKWSDEALNAFRTGSDPYRYPNVNWVDELIKNNSFQSRNNINVQGGLDKAKYFISAGYLFQDGLIKDFSQNSGMNNNYYYKRYNFRSNLDIQPTKSLTLNLDLSGVFSERNAPESGGRGGYNNVFNEISQISELSPWKYPIYNPDGSYGIAIGNTFNSIVGRLAHYGYERDFRNDLTANFRATQKLDFITKGLSVRGVLGYNNYGGFTRNLTRDATNDFPAFSYDPATGVYTPFNVNFTKIALPSLSNSNTIGTRKMNWQVSANYDRTFGNHRVYGLGLYNFQNDIAGSNVPQVFEGYTFRAGYDFKSKYLLEFNAGYNGTSAFEQAKRYSWFPAVSAGWNISEEPFFKNNVKFIDLLKIRGSYGLTGSDDIGGSGQYAYIAQFERTPTGARDRWIYNLGDNPGSSIQGIREGSIANTVSWEIEEQTNIGMELRMFAGKLSVEADVFRRYRYDILEDRQSVPWYSGYYSPSIQSGDQYKIYSTIPPGNIGEVINKGFETRVTYNGKVKELSFNVSGNVSVAKNKILEMDEPAKEFPWQVLTNRPIGNSLGFDFIGFYTEGDITNPEVAKPASFLTKTFAGDLKYRDVDGDGVINDNDKIAMPYTNLPTTILGLTFGFNYKSFSFTTTAQSGLNFALSGYGQAITPFSNNFREIHKDAWTPENSENPSFPRLTTQGNLSSMATAGNISTFWFRKSDYLRIKTAELGYSLPTKLVGKAGLKSARIYVNGYNLFTWSLGEKNIYDIDPETFSGNDGRDFYPQQKIYNLGVQLGL